MKKLIFRLKLAFFPHKILKNLFWQGEIYGKVKNGEVLFSESFHEKYIESLNFENSLKGMVRFIKHY